VRAQVWSRLEQALDDRGVALLARQRQRRHAVAVGRGGLGAGAQQAIHQRGVAVAHRPVQRGGAVHFRGVRIHFPL
jgi:hypothetical protein